MNNTLIDNSIEALSMTTTLRKCLAIDGIKQLVLPQAIGIFPV
jgi:hypothetical protein